MPIPNSGQISLNDDVNATLQADTNEQDVSLKDNNAVKFTAVSDGDTVTGRSMSELRGQTLFNIMPETEETGNIGESLHLDGIESNHNSIDITDAGSSTAATYTSTEGTFSFWVKIHETDSGSAYFYSSGASSSGNLVALKLHSSGTDHKFVVRIGGDYWYTESFMLDKTGWYNFVVSIDTNISGYEQVKVYGNGLKLKFSTQATMTVGTAVDFGSNQRINDWDFSLGNGLDATYGNFIYVDGKALLPSEFGELKYGIWTPKQVNKPSTDSLITTNLTANYDFVNGSIEDTSGNGNHLTKTGTGGTASQNNYGIWTTPGSTSSFLNMPDIINSHSTTINMWVHPNNLSSPREDFFHATKEIYGIWNFANGEYNIYFGSGYIIQNIPARMKWTMLTLTTTSARDVQFYIDGSLVNTRTDSSDFQQDYNYYSNTIGYTHHTSTPNDGEMNFGEIQVYSTGLTAAQVLQNYNATKYKYFYGRNGWHFNLNNTDQGSIVSGSDLKVHLDVGDWDADGTDETSFSGTAWNDKAGSHNFTLTGLPTYSSNNGGYFDFDDGDKASTSTTISNTFANNVTYEMWVNMDEGNNYTLVYGKQSASLNGILIGNFAGSAGNIEVYRYQNGSSSSSSATLTGTGLTTGKWQHLVFVMEDICRVYVDGALTATGATFNATYPASFTELNIAAGYSSSYNGNFKMAQFRVYSKALTAQEVVQNYRATQAHYSVLGLADISGNAKKALPGGTNLSGEDHSKEKLEDAYPNMANYAGVFGYGAISGKVQRNSGRSLRGNYGGFVSDVRVNTGKWYWEAEAVVANSYMAYIGVTSNPESSYNSGGEVSTVVNAQQASKYGSNTNVDLSSPDASFVTSGSYTVTAGTILGFKLDLDAGNFYVLVNNVVKMTDTGLPSDGSKFFHALVGYSNDGAGGANWTEFYMNFGQKAFSYAVPSGYKTLSSANMPITNDPLNQKMSNDNFEVKTYTGLSDPQKIDTLKFKPDLLLIKRIDGSDAFQSYDSIRGPSKQLELTATNAEYQQDGTSLLSFNSDGFSLGADASQRINNTANQFVAYAFKGGGSAVTNSSGTVASQVSANPAAGFSLVEFAGASGANTCGHGLSSAPSLVIMKSYDVGGTWGVYVKDLGANKYLTLNSTGGEATSTTAWNNTHTTSTLFSWTGGIVAAGAGYKNIAYCFANVDGYQKIGTYLGNGSSDHPIYTGFEPVFVLIKNTSSGYSWIITDASRGNDKIIYTNLTQGQDTESNGVKHMNSNGFTLGSAASFNNDGSTFIYLAIAKDPYKYSQGSLQTRNTLTEEFIDKKAGTSTLLDPGNHRNTISYTGTSASRLIQNMGFEPGLTWTQNRSSTGDYYNALVDSIRGAGNILSTNSTAAATTSYTEELKSFNHDGYTLGTGGGNYVNRSGDEYVSWNWKAGDTQVTKKPTYTSAGILTSNLALHYNFADSNTYAGTGTTVYDLTTNDNDATTANSPTWVDRAYGNYFSFDGSNDNATKSNASFVNGISTITIEAWLNYQGNSDTYGHVLGVANTGTTATSTGVAIAIQNSDDQLYFWYQGGGSERFTGYTVPIGKWIHVVGTVTGTEAKTYVNGILIHTHTLSSALSFVNDSNNRVSLGDYSYNGNHHYKGFIGQARIYTAVLTQSQIRANYDATRTLYQGVGTTGNVLQTGLLNNIDVDSFSSYDPNSFGDTNKVAVLNGSTSEINLGDGGVGASGTSRQTFSVSLWINTTSTSSYSAIINDYATTYSFVVEMQSSGVLKVINNFSSTSVVQTTGSTVVNDGRWHHIVLINNTGDSTQKLYIDSVLEISQTLGSGTKTADSFNVGYYTGLSYHFNGKIDQLRTFNKALSNAEISKLFSETSSTTSTLQVLGDSSCVAAFNFNSDSGTTVDNLTGSNDGTASNVTYAFDNTTSYRAKDQTSNNLSGGLINATFNEANNWGTSIKFDGSGDYVQFNVGLGRTASQDVTREFWLKVDDYPASSAKDTFFYCGDMNDDGYYETIAIHSDGTLQYQERNNTSSNTGQDISVSTPADGVLINENVWYHIAYTVSGKKKSIYINGEIAANDFVDYTKVNNSSYPATLGAFRGSNSATFHGEIAQFRSYTSALTEAQIKANYDATRAQFFSALTHSLVSVNDKAGFSIARYESTGTSGDNVAHGLSEAPDITIFKSTTAGTNWITSITNIINNKYLYINNDGTGGSGGFEIDKNSILLNNTYGDANTAGRVYMAYSWKSIPGYSKISKYKGNGSSGNKIYTGFKPGFLMIKLTASANQNWYIMDTSLYGDSAEKYLAANLTDEETALSGHLDILSDGFELTKNSTAFNTDGYTYLYMAFV